jgi:hypothetical protein
MTKKFLTLFLLVAGSVVFFASCKKNDDGIADPTRNYFPLTFGKYVTYEVDSIYYDEDLCTQYRIKSQLKYVVTDTFTDRRTLNNRLWYILDVFSRPYDGALWRPHSVVLLNPTTNSLDWAQNQVKYVKMMFPIKEGMKWAGNKYAPVNDAQFSFLQNWNYEYKNVQQSYNTNYLNFDNTVTVLENDESVNYPDVDTGVAAHRIYSKSVYAYNVGLVYRELTYTTYKAYNAQCLNGYSVVMRAIDHN